MNDIANTSTPAETATQPIIDISGVSYSFKNHRALENISFQVPTHSLHGFVGPNGAGKTTTLKLVCTLLRPQVGNIRVFGNDIVLDVQQIRRRIGFMPDHFSMYRQMTVYEYLDFFAAAYGLNLQQRDRVIDDVLALTDMGGRRNELINSLSRGMQQRVSIARVLVNDPDLLLLDEPASGLDPRARIELMEILRELQRMGKTIFISSHILSELAELCDSVTIIDRGRIKYSGSMDRLLDREDEHPTFLVTMNEPPSELEDQLRTLTGVVSAEKLEGKNEYRISIDSTQTDSGRLLRDMLDLGVTLAAFNPDRKHLNQAFLDLTERGVR